MDLNKIYVQHSSLSGIAQSLQTVVSNIKVWNLQWIILQINQIRCGREKRRKKQ